MDKSQLILERMLQEIPALGLLLVAVVLLFWRIPKPKDINHSMAFRRRRILNWLPLGLTYAFLYMGRYNINIAKTTGIMTKAELGEITVIGTTVYALSFLINGPLTDKYGGRLTIKLAAIGSAAANLGMAFVLMSDYEGSLVGPFGALYGVNMYFQSFGAVSIVKVNSSWFHIRERGTFGAMFGVLISLGIYLAYDWGAIIVGFLPVHYAFMIPAIFLAIFFVIDHLMVYDTPAQAGQVDFDPEDASSGDDWPRLPVFEVARKMFTNPVILTIAFIEMCSGFIRGAVMKWGYFFVNETAVEGTKPFITQHWGAFLFCAGVLGGVFAGVVSDKVFHSRRGPTAGILYGGIIAAAIATLAFITTPFAGYLVVLAILAVIGVHGMLAGTASMDFGGRKNAGLAVGLIDGMVYLGFGLQSVLLGYWLPTGEAQADPENWRIWMYTIMPAAIIGFFLCLRIWNAKPVKKSEETAGSKA